MSVLNTSLPSPMSSLNSEDTYLPLPVGPLNTSTVSKNGHMTMTAGRRLSPTVLLCPLAQFATRVEIVG